MIGKKVIFDPERFQLDLTDPRAIGILCKSKEELSFSLDYLNNLLPNLKRRGECHRSIDELWTDVENWTSIYCCDVTGTITMCITSDMDCDNEHYETDYWFRDITFPQKFEIEIDVDSVMSLFEV